MTALHVGMEVVCVNDAPRVATDKDPREAWPVAGTHYTIRTIEDVGGIVFIRLNEIINPVLSYSNCIGECQFAVSRFRPIDNCKIEVFRRMCVSNKPLVPVE